MIRNDCPFFKEKEKWTCERERTRRASLKKGKADGRKLPRPFEFGRRRRRENGSRLWKRVTNASMQIDCLGGRKKEKRSVIYIW